MKRIDPERVRQLIAQGLTDGQIAVRLGVSRTGVTNNRRAHGVATKWPRIDVKTVRKLAAAGLTDGQIADRLGVAKTGVLRVRHRAGVPAAYDPRNPPAHVKANWVRCAALASPKGNAAHKAKHRAFAEQYGLPADMRPTEVKILLALIHGPATAADIRQRCGWRPGRNLSASGKQGGWLSRLIRIGYVVSVYRSTPAGRGRLPNLYTLTLKALDLLTKGESDGKAEQEEVAGPQDPSRLEDEGRREPTRQAAAYRSPLREMSHEEHCDQTGVAEDHAK